MDERTRRALRLAGVQAALVAAGIHLFWGLPRFVAYARIGRMPDLRPPAFVLSAVAVAAAVALLYAGARERPVYAFLAAVMLAYLAGYAAWHLAGHPVFVDGALRAHYHPDDPVEVVAAHLRSDLLALVAAALEAGAAAAFAALLLERE